MKYIPFHFINNTAKKQDSFRKILAGYTENKKIRQMDHFIQHGTTSTLQHGIHVAKVSCFVNRCLKLGLDDKKVIETSLLHDYYLYDWHVKDNSRKLHGPNHPRTACDNAIRDFHIPEDEQEAILSHMWPLTLRHPPRNRLAVLLCCTDKICSVSETLRDCPKPKDCIRIRINNTEVHVHKKI